MCSTSHDNIVTQLNTVQDQLDGFEARMIGLEANSTVDSEQVKEMIDSRVDLCISTSAEAVPRVS